MSAPGKQRTVLDALAHRLALDPDGPYLDFGGEAYTAREMDLASNRLAHALTDLGVVRGDRVATLLENTPAQVISFFGALKLGAVQVPINTAYKGEFLRHQLVDSGSRVLVVQGDFASRITSVGNDGLPGGGPGSSGPGGSPACNFGSGAGGNQSGVGFGGGGGGGNNSPAGSGAGGVVILMWTECTP